MRRKILLIDESAMLRRVATNILQAEPSRYEVVSASRAAEGFALACVGGVELVLVDYLLAGSADAPLCRRLQSDARTIDVPVVLMVGHGIQAPALPDLPNNVVDVLNKPFSPEQLTGTVRGILGLVKNGTPLAVLRGSLHPGGVNLSSTRAEIVAQVDPSSRVNGNGHGTTVLRSLSPAKTGPVPPPTEGETPLFSGDTTVTSLRSVLKTVEEAGESGVLRLWPEDGEPTEVIFDGGKLVVVTTRNGAQYSARAAESLPAKVSPATVEEAVAEQNTTGTPFLLTLGTRGLLSKSSAVSLLRRFSLRQFARLLPQRSRPPVRFEFSRLEVLPPYALRLDPSTMPLDQWLLEATRCLRAEDVAANLRHEGSVGSPYYQAEGQDLLRGLELSETEREYLQMVNGRTDLPTLAKALGTSQEALYLLTFRFRCLDVLSYRTAPAAFVMTPRAGLRRVLPLHR